MLCNFKKNVYFYVLFGKYKFTWIMNKIISVSEAVSRIESGMTVMVGGFLGAGAPERIIDALVEKGVRDLTLICNDTAFPDRSLGKLVVNKQAKRVIVSHIGTNPETIAQMNAGELKVDLVPQGTLAEKIRAKGAGLGAVVTPTGIGTMAAEGRQIMTIEGKDYIVEMPLGADVAILGASIADESGNLFYRGTTKNFNPIMAMAADLVIAEPLEIVPVGTIEPECVHTPNIFVDYIVK